MNLNILSEYDRDEVEELLQVIEQEGWNVNEVEMLKDHGEKEVYLDLVK